MFRRRRSRARRADSTPRRPQRQRRLSLEALEERRLLAVMTVTNLNDDTLGNLAGGGLSLREAIEAINTGANVDGIGPTSGVFGTNDEIRFDPTLFTGGPGTITLADAAGELKLLKAMTITGPGATLLKLDATNGTDNTFNTGDGFRIFNVDDGTATDRPAIITGLTLTGGDASSSGGAISTFESLTVRDSVISGNAAFGGTSRGGAIYANAASNRNLEITRSKIAGNSSGEDGGGVSASGTAGVLTFQDCIITQNTSAGSGGGLRLFSQNNGTINIIDTTISENTAPTAGGGVSLTVTLGSTANVIGTTLNNNVTTGNGGGIHLLNPAGTAIITNSTISGNRADNDAGGIFANTVLGASTLIAYSTITRNNSDDDASGGGSGGGLYGNGTGTLSIRNAIIAQNFDGSATAADDLDLTTSAPGTVFFNFNLVGNGTGSGFAPANPDANGNVIGSMAVPVDPLLAPLLPNGGPTKTHRLLTGSPAIDTGDPAAVAGMGGIPEFDQRGNTFTRVFDGVAPAGAVIDIGAYELQSLGAAQAFVVDILADEDDGDYSPGDLSLREAVGLANGNVGFADSITFASGLNGGTILLVRGEIGISEELTINASSLASGITIDASGNDLTPNTNDGMGSRVFLINDGDGSIDNPVTLIGLTLTGGDVGGSSGNGGAIFSTDSLTLRNSVITGNAATNGGGGIFLYQFFPAVTLTHEITGCTISGNSAVNYGGGMSIQGSATITNTTISGNSTDGYAGGIALIGAATTISGSTISGNRAGVDGGGLYLSRANVTIINSTISGNLADRFGGGFVGTVGVGETISVRYSTITQNTADDDDDGMGRGGGVYLRAAGGGNGTFNLVSTIIAQNTDKTDAAPDLDATTNPPGAFSPVFNLIGIGSNSGITNGVNGNQVGTPAVPINARLVFLADNGGPTKTHALQLNSPALDAGDPGFGPPPSFDQRGFPFVRVFDGDGNFSSIIDIGAFEVNAFELVEPDEFELNDTQQTATILGSEPTVILRDLSIANINLIKIIINDEDWFRYRAHDTGKLDVRILFRDDFGNLVLEIFDKFGESIAIANSQDDDEQLIIPVVAGEEYFIRVSGVNGAENNYALEVENFPAPVPTGVVLDPASDTGMMDNDNLTSDTTPTVLIQTDVLNFVDTNLNGLFQDPDTNPSDTEDVLDALSPAEANRILNNIPTIDDDDGGIAVEVTFVNTTNGTFVTGIAEAVIGTLPDVYRFTPAAPLTPGVYLVSARTRVFDGQSNAMGDPAQKTARSNASPPLRLVIDTTGAPADGFSIDMLTASDTGMLNNDNVTNKMQPAFQGIAPANSKVRIFANAELVGQGVAGSDTSDVGHPVGGIGGLANDGLGLWEITVEPLADNGYDIRVEVEDAAGNVTAFNPFFNGPNQPIDVVIDTLEPNTPYLDLVANDDTGRHDEDNITKDNVPTVTMSSTDPNINLAQLLFQDNLKFRIFDRYENTAEFKLYDSALDADVDAVMVAADMFTSLTFIEERLPDQFFALFGANGAVLNVSGAGVLADGVHNLKLEVEDRAGNISHDFLLTIVVDTENPPATFGEFDGISQVDGLAASSDTGVTTVPETYADRITSDTTPTFWGRAEADSTVRIYLDLNSNGGIDLTSDVFLGQTTAIPLDGNDAEPMGYWEITSIRDLNEIVGLPKDGLRRILVYAEDVAGNPMPIFIGELPVINVASQLFIFIDTQGPQITDVNLGPGIDYDLFDPKPSTDGPTPLVHSLFIDVRDLPSRLELGGTIDFLYDALVADIAETIGNYELVGDYVGQVIIQQVIVHFEPLVSGEPAFASIELVFSEPLPDDRYTLTVRDNLVDPANNELDGESGNPDPFEFPDFPSGDGVPGGNFVARFTIDTRPEIGVWAAGIIHIDTNGNFHFDPENVDFTNRDLVYTLGFSSDYIFAGNFALGAGDVADGFDKLAVYGRVGDQWRFLVDFDNDGVPDEEFLAPSINGIPVAGNFDGDLANGDEVGIFTGSAWFFDTNHDFIVDDGFATDYAGFPVAGDFDGDGDDDVATYIASLTGGNQFHIDLNSAGLGSAISINGSADHTFRVGLPSLGTFGFPGVRERPVAADMNADGADDLGLWVPDGTAILPGDQGEWFFLLSEFTRSEKGGGVFVTETVIDRILGGGIVDFVPFSTTPFGQDLYARFGNSFALPIVGNFDPPASPSASAERAGPTPGLSSPNASTPTPTSTTPPPTAPATTTPTSTTPAPAPTTAASTAAPPTTTTTTTASNTAAKVVVPAVTVAASSTAKTAAKTATSTTSTKAAKKIAVPAIQPATTKSKKTAAAVTTSAKAAKTTTKAATPAAVPPAKTTAKVAKASTSTTKKSTAAAPPKPAVAKTAAAAKTTLTKASKKKVAAPSVTIQTTTTVASGSLTNSGSVTLVATMLTPSPAPLSTILLPAVPIANVVTLASSVEHLSTLQLATYKPAPVIEPVALTPIVAPVYVAPAIAGPEIGSPATNYFNAGSLQVSTLSGTLEFTGNYSVEPALSAGSVSFAPAVADAAVTDLRLTLADVTTDTDAIAADRPTQPGPTSADAELVLALAWDSVLRANET